MIYVAENIRSQSFFLILVQTRTASIDHYGIIPETTGYVTLLKVCVVSLTYMQERTSLGIVLPTSTWSVEKRLHSFPNNKTVRFFLKMDLKWVEWSKKTPLKISSEQWLTNAETLGLISTQINHYKKYLHFPLKKMFVLTYFLVSEYISNYFLPKYYIKKSSFVSVNEWQITT